MLAPIVAAAATVAAAPYLPCVSAVTPRMVDDADLPGANAARSAVGGLGILAGPAVGGLLLLLGSPALAFGLNGLTFGFSVLAVLAIRDRAAFRSVRPGQVARLFSPAALLSEMASGAAALRARPEALRLVGADIMCSVLYGAQTVLLLVVASRVGLGAGGYGYLFAGIGAGGCSPPPWPPAARFRHPRYVLAAALAAAGLPMPLLAVTRWPAVAIALVAVTGIGAMLVEILTETCLQRVLDEEMFGRAYGLALPASIAGIVAGSLIAPLLAGTFGTQGALAVVGCALLGYALLLLRNRSGVAGRSAQPSGRRRCGRLTWRAPGPGHGIVPRWPSMSRCSAR